MMQEYLSIPKLRSVKKDAVNNNKSFNREI